MRLCVHPLAYVYVYTSIYIYMDWLIDSPRFRLWSWGTLLLLLSCPTGQTFWEEAGNPLP